MEVSNFPGNKGTMIAETIFLTIVARNIKGSTFHAFLTVEPRGVEPLSKHCYH